MHTLHWIDFAASFDSVVVVVVEERERERERERKRAGSMVIQVEAVLVETMRSTKIMIMMHTKFSGFST